MEKEKKIFKKDFTVIKPVSVNNRVFQMGFLLDSVPSKLVEEFETIYQNSLKDINGQKRHNNYLAGEIENEFLVESSEEFENYLIDLCRYYEVKTDGYIKMLAFDTKFQISLSELIKPKRIKIHHLPKLTLGPVWMNMQKKHEYNPVHNHTGVMSFVVWHKIPYTVEDEMEKRPNKYRDDKDNMKNGAFLFQYTMGDEIIAHSVADSSDFENVIAVFPSSLRHAVNPFYSSEEYRVSFSGNLYFDLSNFYKHS